MTVVPDTSSALQERNVQKFRPASTDGFLRVQTERPREGQEIVRVGNRNRNLVNRNTYSDPGMRT